MQTYETIFITTPTLTEDDEKSTVESMSSVVTDGGGSFTANDRLGRRRLAYPIRKHSDGVYVRFLYDSESDVPKELERRFRLSDKILRSLTVRLEPNWAVAAKEQSVRDAQARVEAAEREKQLEIEREAAAAAAAAAEAAAPSADEAEAADGADGADAAKSETPAAPSAPANEPSTGSEEA